MLHISTSVREALSSKKPVVALESTLITHGFSRPENFEVAQSIEDAVAAEGVVPATIAVIRGVARIGLSADELRTLAEDAGASKASVRDLPCCLARQMTAGTTVAASIYLAARAGIKVFATGGIGGVHRGMRNDISADLPELARTSIICVCAGAKSILDLSATREWIETAGIPVAGWQTDEFPAFYSRTSGLDVDVRTDSPDEVTGIWREKLALGLPGAMLLVVPPPEDVALEGGKLESIISEAVEESERNGIIGKDITPFVLAEVSRRSGGESVKANRALLVNNARVAARVARGL